MAINKVEYDGETLIDLTEDTVDEESLLAGVVAHSRSGERITGKFDPLANTELWRADIDDWATIGRKLGLYTNYINNYWTMTGDGTFSITGDSDEFDVVTSYSGWQGLGLFFIDFTKEENKFLLGKRIEIGAIGLSYTSNAKPSYQIITESGGTQYVGLSPSTLNSVLDDNLTGFAIPYDIPEDALSLSFRIWDGWLSSSEAGSIHGEKVYLIIPDEVTPIKTWYTNLVPTLMNFQSAALFDLTSRMDPVYGRMYNGAFSISDPWGWSSHKFSDAELALMRGRTYEFGCKFLTKITDGTVASEDITSLEIGIGVNDSNPRTYKLNASSKKPSPIFSVKGEEIRYCVTFTVPEDCTSLYLGCQSYGAPRYTSQLTVVDLYLYDVNEEGIEISGKGLSNTYLKVSRVGDDFVPFDSKKSRPNTLYFAKDGKMYMTSDMNEMMAVGGSSVIEITNAKYEQLSSEEKNNGIPYFIKDREPREGSSSKKDRIFYWNVTDYGSLSFTITELNINQESTLLELCTAIIEKGKSIRELQGKVEIDWWINNASQIGKEIRETIGDYYGNLNLRYANACVYLEFISFNNSTRKYNVYQAINNPYSFGSWRTI